MRGLITSVIRAGCIGRQQPVTQGSLLNLGRAVVGCQPRPALFVAVGDDHCLGRNHHKAGLLAAASLLAACLLYACPVAAQEIYFGQNKVQYKDFEWSVFKTEHFEFFYHQGGEEIAHFAAVASEMAYEDLRRAFRFEISQRVPIILYNSHNDFQQTNVVYGILQEGIGGFTEFLKHRVVVPFQGSYKVLRHVLHHELVHAVSMAMIYGTGIASLISQAQSPRLPLWFVEGLAEYQSIGWDMDADAFVRDAVITGYLPKLDAIYGGLLAYKGGQSFFHYLAQTYGSGRIGDILSNLRMLNSVDRAFIAAVGKPVEELSEDWHRYLRRTYWPEIQNREQPDEFATPLTDHQEDGSTYNVFPALSPAGDKVAFISNRRHYMDLYVVSALDGSVLSRLGKGEQVSMFEEMHILQGGIAWSPDGTRLAVAAKGGKYDQIYIVDAETGRVVREINPEIDGVFEPAWSPDGNTMVFVGIQDGYSDLYLYDLRDDSFIRLTESKAGEGTPAWSSDGTRLAYTSDAVLSGHEPDEPLLPVPYGPENIWVMEMTSGHYRTETAVNGPFDDSNPTWGPDDSTLAFVSFRSGVRNLYVKDLTSGQVRPLTNILSGVASAHWSTAANVIVFSAFNEAGFDIFLLKDPLNNRVPETITATRLVEQIEQERLAAAARPAGFTTGETTMSLGDLSKLRFRPIRTGFSDVDEPATGMPGEELPLTRELGAGVSASEEEPYRLRMTPDLVLANAGYHSFWGLAGSSYLEMSDILGNHRLSVMTSLWSTLDNSNYQAAYTYLGRRWNLGASIFYYNYFYMPDRHSRALYADRTWGGIFLLSYPFSRFQRIDLETYAIGIFRRIYLTGLAERSDRQVFMPKLSLVGDNALPGITGYINGHRYAVGLSYSPPWLERSLSFTSLTADFRSYIRLGKENTFVFRVAAGASEGRDPQQFFIGGNGFWWGPSYASSELYEIDNLYFATFQSPLRGFDFYEFSGSRFILTNIEFRFPLIRLLAFGWPVSIGLGNIQGALFCDMGMAWDGLDVDPFDTFQGFPGFDDIKSGVGMGARMNLGIFIIRLDVAWKNTLRRIVGAPRWHIALGPEF